MTDEIPSDQRAYFVDNNGVAFFQCNQEVLKYIGMIDPSDFKKAMRDPVEKISTPILPSHCIHYVKQNEFESVTTALPPQKYNFVYRAYDYSAGSYTQKTFEISLPYLLTTSTFKKYAGKVVHADTRMAICLTKPNNSSVNMFRPPINNTDQYGYLCFGGVAVDCSKCKDMADAAEKVREAFLTGTGNDDYRIAIETRNISDYILKTYPGSRQNYHDNYYALDYMAARTKENEYWWSESNAGLISLGSYTLGEFLNENL